jgi:hypothetical protein
MTYTETHTITNRKLAQRNLTPEIPLKNAQTIVTTVNNRSLQLRGWTVSVPDRPVQQHNGGMYDAKFAYEMTLIVEFSRADNGVPHPHEFPNIVRNLFTASKHPAAGTWELVGVDGEDYVPSGEIADKNDMLGYEPINLPDTEEFESYFNHLYGLDSQIGMLRKTMEANIRSGWERRRNVVLYGEPGCGKSDICRSFKKMFTESDGSCPAILEYDGTAITQAGVIEDFKNRDSLPRIVIIEEIEKCANADALLMLLGMLDTRGEIRKTTKRENVQRSTKVVCIATVNNYQLFSKLHSNALESRFDVKIRCPRPSREMLAHILEREVRDSGGSYDWIQPTLNYCDAHKITDPRQVISLCLVGADDWKTGAFEKMLQACAPEEPEIIEEESVL